MLFCVWHAQFCLHLAHCFACHRTGLILALPSARSSGLRVIYASWYCYGLDIIPVVVLSSIAALSTAEVAVLCHGIQYNVGWQTGSLQCWGDILCMPVHWLTTDYSVEYL